MSTDYVAGRVEEALAHVGETDVHVSLVDGALSLSGNVATAARHAEVLEVVHGAAEGLEVRDGVCVVRAVEPDGAVEEAIT